MTISKARLKLIKTYRNGAQLRSSKYDTDIYPFIQNGFLIIQSEHFSKEYSNSIIAKYDLRARLINKFLFIDPKLIQNLNHEIRFTITFVCFNEESDDFFLQVTIDEPTPLQQLILDDTRESTLEHCAVHRVVMAKLAAVEALKDLDNDETGT